MNLSALYVTVFLFQCALSIDPTDKGIQDALARATKNHIEQRTSKWVHLTLVFQCSGLSDFV